MRFTSATVLGVILVAAATDFLDIETTTSAFTILSNTKNNNNIPKSFFLTPRTTTTTKATTVASTTTTTTTTSSTRLLQSTTSSTTTTTTSDTTNVEEENSTTNLKNNEKKTKTKTTYKKDDRLRMMKSDQFHRRGFKEVRNDVEKVMNTQYKSTFVENMKESNYILEKDGVKIYLAKDFGFCWGVERSIALAYEAVEHFPDRTIHITNELIHNPEVNDKLQSMNVQMIEKRPQTNNNNKDDNNNNNNAAGYSKNFDNINDGDVVILPAFGASYEEMSHFDEKNVEVVDTTCPWVSKVWNTVDKHQKQGLTSVIHGKYGHEETIATTSFCEDYICVKNYKEAEMVADYILHGGNKEEFIRYFRHAMSHNFDPDTMLKKIGIANQTTMYKKETRAIGQLFQKTMIKKYGPIESSKHYMEFDTICDATQERQDAIHELVENAKEYKLDFILVIGGWDSSNTAHLLEIPQLAGIRSFHINRAECISSDNTITHRTMDGEIITEPFIHDIRNPSKDIIMGVTSGASTPDKAVQDSLSSIFLLKQLNQEK